MRWMCVRTPSVKMHSGQTITLENTDTGDWASRRRAFTLLEVLAALAILAFASSSVLLVIDRSMGAAADSAFQMEAFRLARENMEKILSAESVTENVEYGASERYPDVSCRTVTEAFSESATGQMWIRAVCTAEYVDSKDETQTVELVHWVAMLSDKQAEQLVEDEDLEALAAEQLIDDIDLAAEYAGVDAETIDLWMENGLLTTEDGRFVRHNLDIYSAGNGQPAEEEKEQQVETIEELAMKLGPQDEGAEDAIPGEADGEDSAQY